LKDLIYNSIKHVIKFGLHAYHKKIKVEGLDNIPKNKPVLFLPNHQSALLDVILIAVDCNRKPFFLTRSDVFGKPLLNRIFSFFRMIPIYRIRDGRDTLSKNDAIFNRCAEVLGESEAIVMFPEANHNLKRRVRNLSKGFTRVLFRSLEVNPDIDIQIVPVGLNYKEATSFPDSVAVYYGEPISVKSLIDLDNKATSILKIKNAVSSGLKQLTTHISSEENYDAIIHYLNHKEADFLKPESTNEFIHEFNEQEHKEMKVPKHGKKKSLLLSLFMVFNFPVILLWKSLMKPKVWEPEFMGTLRFATAFIGFVGYYLLLLIFISFLASLKVALITIFAIFLFNWLFVKFG
jgi:1-acyl-sn-glycerol-3-phosphate acyltransferase